MPDDPIKTAAENPASVEQDGTKVSEHSIPDKIAADRYTAAKSAGTKRSTGLRFFKFVPPGAV